jgi:pyruvate/2-oxoglutarate dehydrogenase complex dihydrolipoamide acyltransferase (E2) component
VSRKRKQQSEAVHAPDTDVAPAAAAAAAAALVAVSRKRKLQDGAAHAAESTAAAAAAAAAATSASTAEAPDVKRACIEAGPEAAGAAAAAAAGAAVVPPVARQLCEVDGVTINLYGGGSGGSGDLAEFGMSLAANGDITLPEGFGGSFPALPEDRMRAGAVGTHAHACDGDDCQLVFGRITVYSAETNLYDFQPARGGDVLRVADDDLTTCFVGK